MTIRNYEIWILGYNEDDTVNDYELLLGTFEDRKVAEWFFRKYKVMKPHETPKAKLVLEEVEDYSCVDILAETDL